MHIDKKIFIGTVEVSGYANNVSKGLRELGYFCENVSYQEHNYKYSEDLNLPLLIKISRKIRTPNKFIEKIPFIKFFCIFASEIINILWSILAIFKYDVFIFLYGKSLIRFNIDLPILKLLGKTVISNLSFGSETRPPYLDGFTNCNNKLGKYDYLDIAKSSKRKGKLIRFHQKYCNFVIGSPTSTSQFAVKPFINSFILGFPVKVNNNLDELNTSCTNKGHTYIVHAPSHRKGKGTQEILRAIDNLKNKGYSISLNLLDGVTNREVIKAIKECDLVIDQIYSDTPMAGLASEAASYAKPSIVGGYGLTYIKNFMDKDCWPPVKECLPEDIENAIKDLIEDEQQRLDLGTRANKYIVEKRSISVIAKYYDALIKNMVPSELWFDPKNIEFIYGTGQSQYQTKEIIEKLVSKYGDQSLGLEHNQSLKKSFLGLVNASDE